MIDTPYRGNFLGLALVALMVGHALWQASRKRWHLLDPLNFFWAGIVMVFVVQLFSDGAFLLSWHGAKPIHQTLLAALLLCAFVVIGYESSTGARVAWRLPVIAPRLDPGRLHLLAWLVIGFGLLGYSLTFYCVGGMENFLAVGRGWAGQVRSLPIPSFLQTLVMQLPAVLPIGAVMLLLHAQMFSRSAVTRAVVWVVVGLMWLWFLYLGTRSRLIWMTLAILAAVYLPQRRSPALWLAIPVFAGLILLTSFQQHYRGQFVNLSFNLSEEQKVEVWDRILPSFLLADGKREAKELAGGSELNCAISVIKLVPDSAPYNYGHGFLELLTRWVPRAVWPSKRWPHMESMQDVLEQGGLSDHRDDKTGLLAGPAFTIVGYWYNAGGVVGLVIGGWLAGWLMRFLRTVMDRSATNQAFLVLYPPVMAIGFLDAASSPFYWAYFVPFTLAPVVLAVWLCRNPGDQAVASSASQTNSEPPPKRCRSTRGRVRTKARRKSTLIASRAVAALNSSPQK